MCVFFTEARTNSSELDVDLLQSKLGACESRAAHLTALLSEAESDAARLSQLNAVLKEEIRRQQRSEERAQHAHNLEYLKNIVVKVDTIVFLILLLLWWWCGLLLKF